MINETIQSNPTPTHLPFGMRLQSAREALGLESKDAAAQLRLNEKIILMLEKDCYGTDIPATFLRGYLRSYGKLLQIPDNEIRLAIEPIQQNTSIQPLAPIGSKQTPPLTSGNYFMQLFTYLIVLTLIGLVGVWWYTHPTSTTTSTPTVAENHLTVPPIETPAVVAATPAPTPPPVVALAPSAPKQQIKAPVVDITDNDTEADSNDNTD